MGDRSRTMTKQCRNCGNDFVIPVCRDHREHCCSSQCKVQYRRGRVDAARESRRRECLACSSVFYPRQTQIDSGQGKYCTKKCLIKQMIFIAHQPEANAKRVVSFMKTMQGKFKSGEDHPQWTGGREAASARRYESGKALEYLKKYRAANPERVREWTLRRRASKQEERIEYGFYKKLFELQKGKCAICKTSIASGYHVDHVYPLSSGGSHHKHNIQLLCQSCNCKKSSKDPIEFMQSKGFLL